MQISEINSDVKYKELLKKVDSLMNTDPSPDSEEGQLLNHLTTLVEEYETKMDWELPKKN